ncbi:MAG: hypothetical protein M2R45_02848 [Verrucomicrobia subdivision 3 bacterium]|nr:hypothetical protein [Limisphaerales bacterium]MCS1415449.1 hypothetical protein [Limisphaerales bacterium]
MQTWTLVKRSLQHYAKSHLGTLAGAVVASAVLVGALAVGDSVRGSLRDMAVARLGSVESSLVANERVFRSALADEMQTSLGREVVSALVILGTASSGGGEARANQVNVLGVESDFWTLALDPTGLDIKPGQVVLNDSLARQLRAAVGDSILFRVGKPSNLSRDAPLSPEEDTSVAMRLKVQAVVNDRQFGRFGLHASQLPPLNAFVSQAYLQERVEQPGGANLLLVGLGDSALGTETLMTALRQHWRLADAQLELKPLPSGEGAELRSKRVFLDETIVEAARTVNPKATGILTYFVNSLEVGGRVTPYSMVAAASAPLFPEDLGDDAIILNQWLAEDLQAAPGDELTMKYYAVGIGRELFEREATFTVNSIVPLAGLYADPSLMPDFPGLKDAENCRNWDTGLPIDLDSIRSKDNAYWEEHRGTPKAFVSAATGGRLWRNRFGSLTAVRFGGVDAEASELANRLASAIGPESIGLSFYPVRDEAMASVNQAQDFGGLFIGFSFFLILAALILMSLLFQFSMEQRTGEAGILLALGLRPKTVKRFFYFEGGALAALGAVLGAVGGVLYARAMLYGLTTIWSGAVGTSAIDFHLKGGTLVGGALGGMLVAWLTIWLAARKQAARPARELLQGDGGESEGVSTRGLGRRLFLAVLGFVLAIGMVGWAVVSGERQAAGLFFGAGGLLLISGMMGASWWLRHWARSGGHSELSLFAMGIRSGSRRVKRSVATMGLLACGSFLVVAVGASKLDAVKGAAERQSGTGGFAFWGQTTQAVTHDLNGEAGQEFFLLDDEVLSDVRFVQFRVLPGEDASCLNLNRVQRPQLMGVNPAELAYRKSFTFASVDQGQSDAASPWLLLNDQRDDGAIPAIADQNSMLWAMGKKVGDKIQYRDGKGGPFEIVLVGGVANSILQGNLIISEKRFVERYPHESGYRTFLIDAPWESAEAVAAILSRALQDVGLELTSTVQRLSDFNAVQNTYLSTFQMLGGLGLLLGSIGLGVVVLRNVWERRGELALLKAVGFRPGLLRWLVLSEHAALLVIGLLIGVGAALIAVIPALLSPGAEIPYVSLSWTLLAVLISGLLWTWLADGVSLRGHLLEALRND